MKPSVCYKRQADQETTSEDLYGSYIPLLLTYDCGLSIDWHAIARTQDQAIRTDRGGSR
jgi:hypothetical protein